MSEHHSSSVSHPQTDGPQTTDATSRRRSMRSEINFAESPSANSSQRQNSAPHRRLPNSKNPSSSTDAPSVRDHERL